MSLFRSTQSSTHVPVPYLLLDIDGPEHLQEEPFGVLEELFHLEVGFQLVELLDLCVCVRHIDR